MNGSELKVAQTLHKDFEPVDEIKLYHPYGRPMHSQYGGAHSSCSPDPFGGTCVNGVGGRSYIITNYTDKPIAVYDSNNYLTIIEPVPYMSSGDISNGYRGQVTVSVFYRYSVNFNSECKYSEYTRRRWKSVGKVDCPVIGSTFIEPENIPYVKHAVANDGGSIVGNNRKVYGTTERMSKTMVYSNVIELLKNYGGAFYSETFDLVFDDMTSTEGVWIHPRSQEELLAVADRPELSDRVDRMIVEVKVNDPEIEMSAAFINLSGHVMQIPITRNSAHPAGITICTKKSTDPTIRDEFYAINDDNCPLKLFSSRKAAMFDGNSGALAELESLKLKNENIKAAHETQMAKHLHEKAQAEAALEQLREKVKLSEKQAEDNAKNARLEKERADHAAVLAAEQHERDMAKLREAERIRDDAVRKNEQLENASFFRKSFVEVTKIIAAAIGAVGMAATLFIKLKKG